MRDRMGRITTWVVTLLILASAVLVIVDRIRNASDGRSHGVVCTPYRTSVICR